MLLANSGKTCHATLLALSILICTPQFGQDYVCHCSTCQLKQSILCGWASRRGSSSSKHNVTSMWSVHILAIPLTYPMQKAGDWLPSPSAQGPSRIGPKPSSGVTKSASPSVMKPDVRMSSASKRQVRSAGGPLRVALLEKSSCAKWRMMIESSFRSCSLMVGMGHDKTGGRWSSGGNSLHKRFAYDCFSSMFLYRCSKNCIAPPCVFAASANADPSRSRRVLRFHPARRTPLDMSTSPSCVVRPQARSAADDDATDSATDAGMASAIVEGMHQPRGSVVLLTMAPWGGMLSQPHATLPNTQQCLQVDRSGHTPNQ